MKPDSLANGEKSTRYGPAIVLQPCMAKATLSRPFADDGVRAGFPSPAQDDMREALDFNRDMIRHPEATFYARVKGESMSGEGIHDGDLLVIDRSERLREGALGVFAVDGEFTLKRMQYRGGKLFLVSSNPDYQPIEVRQGQELALWGVVIYIIKRP